MIRSRPTRNEAPVGPHVPDPIIDPAKAAGSQTAEVSLSESIDDETLLETNADALHVLPVIERIVIERRKTCFVSVLEGAYPETGSGHKRSGGSKIGSYLRYIVSAIGLRSTILKLILAEL